jgi:hypothetical protein
MFEVKDGCQIPVPYQDKCGHGYSTCRGKTCSNYVLPAYLIDRERKLNELKEWETALIALTAKIAKRKGEISLPAEPKVEEIKDESKDEKPEKRPYHRK